MKNLFLFSFIIISHLSFSQLETKNCWNINLGGTLNDTHGAITADNNKNVFLTGSFQGINIDFNPNDSNSFLMGASGASDIFLEKVDSNGKFIWVKKFGNFYGETPQAIATDSEGNIYLIGYYYDQVNFNGTNPNGIITSINGGSDIFILKLDNNGNFVWVKTIGGPELERVNSFVIDLNDNLYLTGSFEDSVNFSTNAVSNYITSKGSTDYFIQKLDKNGDVQWTNTGGNISYDRANDINVDSKGNVYVIGTFYNNMYVEFPTGIQYITSKGGIDVFLQKLSSTGLVKWVKVIGSTQHDRAMSINLDSKDNLFVTASFGYEVDLGEGKKNYDGNVLIKLDTIGEFKLVHELTGNVATVKIDANDDFIIAGSYYYDPDFDPSSNDYILKTRGYEDTYIQKLLKDGSFQWVKRTGAPLSNDWLRSIYVDKFSNIYTAVDYSSDTIYSSSNKYSSNGGGDILFQKHSSVCLDSNNFPFEIKEIPIQIKEKNFDAYNINLKQYFSDEKTDSNNLIFNSSPPTGISISISNGIATVSPVSNWFGTDSIIISISDSEGLTIYKEVKFQINSSVGIFDTSVKAINVYPNPVSSILNINLTGKITIMDINGKVIKTETVINNKVDFSNISNGLYFIKSDSQIIKIIKQ